MRKLLVVVGCLLLAACGTTSNTRIAAKVEAPKPGARVLIVKPDIELAVLGVAVVEPKADWSEAAITNVTAEVGKVLSDRDHTFTPFDAVQSMGGRGGQVLRLHEAVGQSIALFSYGPLKMPTKKDAFDWTLGEGAVAFGKENNADYALFSVGRGTYASGGRVAAAIGMSLLGVGMPLGSQRAFASLVDLKTGKVVWFNVSLAGSNDDMREPDGAKRLVAGLLKDVPL